MPTRTSRANIQQDGHINRQADMLEKSMAMLSPLGETVAARFYEILFFDNPRLRPLFEGVSMAAQYRKLWSALAFTVEGYRHPEQLSQTLLELGLRHKKYGVSPEDYFVIQVTLLKTLKEFLGEHWSEPLNRAWSEALQEVSRIMLKGADQTTPTKALSLKET